MRSIDALVDQLVTTGVYNRAVSNWVDGQHAVLSQHTLCAQHSDTIRSHAKAVVQNLLHLTPLQGTFSA